MIIAGLGNPGEDYVGTRHNAGRSAVYNFAQKNDLEFEFDKKLNAEVAKNKKMTLVLPDTFMNKSGNAVKPFVKSVKKARELIVVHDDLDIALGRAKMSFNKSSGGHKGVESVMRAVKTEKFWRIRIGIAPKKKLGSDKLVNNFIVAPFKEDEAKEMKKVVKKVIETLEIACSGGLEKAMGQINSTF